jgi:hypothetical protein
MNTIKSKYENLILIGLIVVLLLHQINVMGRLMVVIPSVVFIMYYNPYKILTQIIHKTGLMSIASSVVLSVSLSFILTILYIGSLGSLYFLVLYGLNLTLGIFYLSKNNAMAYSHFLINILLTQIKYFVIS